jgi:hypothetical protein
MPVSDFGRRVLRAARLEPAVYEEVEHDRTATGQALAVVVLSGLAAAIGGLGSVRPGALVAGTLLAVLGWAVWAGLCLVIGGRLFPEAQTRTDMGELLRVLGFAAAPGIAQVLGVLAPFRTPVLVVTQAWTIVAMVVGVRQALDYRSTARALGVCLAAWIVQIAAITMVVAVFQPRFVSRSVAVPRPADVAPTVGYTGVVKPSGVAPPVE